MRSSPVRDVRDILDMRPREQNSDAGGAFFCSLAVKDCRKGHLAECVPRRIVSQSAYFDLYIVCVGIVAERRPVFDRRLCQSREPAGPDPRHVVTPKNEFHRNYPNPKCSPRLIATYGCAG